MNQITAGTVLVGKYQVDRVLGAGGVGMVVAATHLHLQERVALKFLLPEVVGNHEVVHRFLREAQAAVRLKGEHVARVIDVGTLPEGMPYIVMEYLDGCDLSAHIARRGALLPGEAVDYVLQACEALAEAHALGIVHRDIKPANLFLTQRPDGSALLKVLDFGISKMPVAVDGGMTQAQAIMGTPSYMSPEQLRSSRDVDARADVWALGIVLYESLTGRRPFDAETFAAQCLRIAMEPPPPLGVPVPRGLEAVMLRCLEKDPAARLASVAELAMALAPFAADARSAAVTVERTAAMRAGAGFRRAPTSSMGADAPTTLGGSAAQSTPVPTAVPARRRGIGGIAAAAGAIALAAAALTLAITRGSEQRSASAPVAASAALVEPAPIAPAAATAPVATAPVTTAPAAPAPVAAADTPAPVADVAMAAVPAHPESTRATATASDRSDRSRSSRREKNDAPAPVAPVTAAAPTTPAIVTPALPAVPSPRPAVTPVAPRPTTAALAPAALAPPGADAEQVEALANQWLLAGNYRAAMALVDGELARRRASKKDLLIATLAACRASDMTAARRYRKQLASEYHKVVARSCKGMELEPAPPPAPTPAPAPPPKPAPPPPKPEPLRREDVARRLVKLRGRLLACVPGDASSVIQVDMVIKPDGTMTGTTGKSPKLDACIAGVLKNERFPVSSEGWKGRYAMDPQHGAR